MSLTRYGAMGELTTLPWTPRVDLGRRPQDRKGKQWDMREEEGKEGRDRPYTKFHTGTSFSHFQPWEENKEKIGDESGARKHDSQQTV